MALQLPLVGIRKMVVNGIAALRIVDVRQWNAHCPLLAFSSMKSSVEGIDDALVTGWMVKELGASAPITFSLIAAGRSNLTYRVVDAAGGEFILRRPPVSHVLPTAHDMVREYTILSALHPMGVPVPKTLGLCVDKDISDAAFYVMECVNGVILRERAQAEAAFDVSTRAAIGEHLATTLANLHQVDVAEAGLDGLARHDGYIERQLRRWRGQFEQTLVDDVDYGGLVDAVADQLLTSIPIQQRLSVVHGDYRLDNTVLDSQGQVLAILDWEISTLGDPMADLGLLLVYWTQPGDAPIRPNDRKAPTTAEGFYSREQILAAYADQSSLDTGQVKFYQAFGYWKLACIMQGVFARYSVGAFAGDQGSVSEYPACIVRLAESAKETLEELH